MVSAVPPRDIGDMLWSSTLARLAVVPAVYSIAIFLAVVVGCLADEKRRRDARRVLALLLRRPVDEEPEQPKRRRALSRSKGEP